MAAGRHHSAWAKGWGTQDVHKVGTLQLHPDTQTAIAQSWRCLIHFFPKTLPLPTAPNLTRSSYPATECKLNHFSPNQLVYLQLYSLIVRALRLCDMRSVQI
jgi:CRISPR-associated endonuclease/helicase Cas3